MSELDICKRLKEAGFPQVKDLTPLECMVSAYDQDGNKMSPLYFSADEHITIPDLQELLDALGERFVLLTKLKFRGTDPYTADGWVDERLNVVSSEGDTAWQALANLFIAISEGK